MAMNMDDYFEYVDLFLSDEEMSNVKKSSFIKLLETCRVMNSDEEASLFENKYYRLGNKFLNDKEKIDYELNDIMKVLSDDDIHELTEVRRLAFDATSIKKNKELIKEIKKQITLMQCELGVSPKFVSVFKDVLEDEKKRIYNDSVKSEKKVSFNR